MWKKTLVWNTDSIEFIFKDQVVSIEESIQGDKMMFKATMKNGKQIKEVELKMTIERVSEENNNPDIDKEKKQEYHEQGSLLDSVKLEEELPDDPRVESELSSEKEESVEKMTEKREEHNIVTEEIEVKESDAKKKRKRSDMDSSSEDVTVTAIIKAKSREKNEIEAHLKIPSPKTGINMELNVSEDLAAIIGTKRGERISRPQCVKRLWVYLKEHNLQDLENGQFFTPDATMESVFGNERMKCFHMSKYLKGHLTDPDK